MEHLEQQATPLRVLEFYSGIGGMRYALEEAGVFAEVVEAFEINDTANDVYEHNFGHRPNQGNIQCLTVELLDKYKAHAWLLSPPCQPYTRQGLRKDVEDARAFSFLKILEILPHMSRPPAYLFIENVVGFECSATHNQLVAALEKAEFTMQEFILTPLQFGIPYSRPRYFCLAKKCTLSFLQPEFNGKLLYKPGPLLYSEGDLRLEVHSNVNGPFEHSSNKLIEPELDAVVSCRPILDYLEANVSCADEHVSVGRSSKSQQEDKEFNKHANKDDDVLRAGSSADVVNNKSLGGRPPVINTEADTIYSLYFWVSDALIERWGDAFDIVTPQSKKCCCFTKSYGRFVKGTGSFLATKNELHEGYKLEVSNAIELKDYLKQLGLRYFTAREVANLHSFPPEFSFPDHVSLKQRYALLGNSLSVAVVTYLLRYLFSTPNMDVSL